MDLMELDTQAGDLDRESGAASPALSSASSHSCCDVVLEDAAPARTSARNKQPSWRVPVPKVDYAVDHLSRHHLHALLQQDVIASKNCIETSIVTLFKKKYFRFDSKALQCFPGCSKFPDVREARMQGEDHKNTARGESFCTTAVRARLVVSPSIDLNALKVVGRFLCATPEIAVLPDSDAPLLDVGTVVSSLPEANCARGHLIVQSTGEVIATVQPADSWIFNMTLPRHRRNATCAAHKVPLFVFELLCFVECSNAQFQLVSRAVSDPFEVASIRTLIREVLAFRQMNITATIESTREEQAARERTQSQASLNENDKPALISSPAIPVLFHPGQEETTTMQLAAGYSNNVQRVRLAEASRREEESKKKKNKLFEIPDYSVNSLVQEAYNATDLSFDLPDVLDDVPDFDELVFTGPNYTAVRHQSQPATFDFDFETTELC